MDVIVQLDAEGIEMIVEDDPTRIRARSQWADDERTTQSGERASSLDPAGESRVCDVVSQSRVIFEFVAPKVLRTQEGEHALRLRMRPRQHLLVQPDDARGVGFFASSSSSSS